MAVTDPKPAPGRLMVPFLLNALARALASLGRDARALPKPEAGRGPLAGPTAPPSLAPPPRAPENASLRALTAAALALPGLAQQPAGAAEGDEAGFQYGYYKQSQWQLADGLRTQYSPLRVDNLTGHGSATLFDRWKFAFNYVQDTWSGATPAASAPVALGGNNPTVSGASPLIRGNGSLYYDRQFNAYQETFDPDTGEVSYVKDNRLQHTIASASPETRHQGDFSLGYEWDEAALTMSGGVSTERDYDSRFVGLAGRWDLNRKLTTLNLGLNYNNSDIAGRLDPNAFPYYDSSFYADQIQVQPGAYDTTAYTLRGVRQDWSTRFSLSQVLTKDALVEAGLGYTRSTGYLGNPYKLVDFVFVDPNQTPIDTGVPGTPTLLQPEVDGVLERRPEVRNQGILDLRYVQYVEPLDASVHVGYRFFHDDWGVNSHTFDVDWGQPLGDGWTITPRFRYYSQDAADFYQPYFLFKQAAPRNAQGALDLATVPLNAYSSDYRLSAFGALSAGVTVGKRLGKAVGLEAGFEYYAHAGDLALGSGGLGSWSNFQYYQFNARVKVDLSAASLGLGDVGDAGAPAHHHHHGGHGGGGPAPSGVMFAHVLGAGDAMVGYRFMYSLQDGPMLHGTHRASDAAIVANGCGGTPCAYVPGEMGMYMHMLDLMYAPTDWMTLMLMPQFVSMDMSFRALAGGVAPPSESGHNHAGGAQQNTGGVGDIGMYALFKAFETPGHRLIGTIGFTAPTGSVDQKVNGNSQFTHYGMQLGSGTWDFRPSLTYTGDLNDWSWGGQLNGIVRMENRNASGYALGDMFQATAWGSYSFLDWIGASVRGVYTLQGAVVGQYNQPVTPIGPMDLPRNHGGQYWDIGFGVNARVPTGAFAGNQFGIEWLQPVLDDVNGYQQERTGSLFATWSLGF